MDAKTLLVNGTSGDPAVFCHKPNDGSAWLFDCGSIDNLTTKDVLRCDAVFVSHTHIDHFIGFDRFLRVNVPHFRRKLVIGPAGMAANVAGKMKGYIWNLLAPGQIAFTVREVAGDGGVSEWDVASDHNFEPKTGCYRSESRGPVARVAALSPRVVVDAVALDHGTDSIAYRVSAAGKWRVSVDALSADGLAPGPWLGTLQAAMYEGRGEALIAIAGHEERADILGARYLTMVPGQSVGYITDLAFNGSNLRRCKDLLAETSVLISETSFRDIDRSRAVQKKHLTTRQAALIAASCGVKKLMSFHVSNIYGEETAAVAAEAAAFFETFCAMDTAALDAAVGAELALSASLS